MAKLEYMSLEWIAREDKDLDQAYYVVFQFGQLWARKVYPEISCLWQ